MIKIVTDADASLPEAEMDRYDITTIPLWVHFGEETYREGIDLTADEFYARLTASKALPTTSQPSAGQFVEIYRPLLEAGHEIVSIHLSGDLSGTCLSAHQAIEMLGGDLPISVVDSRTVSVAEALLVRQAALWAEAGRDRETIAADLERVTDRVTVFFTVETLEYLAKGGRIGKAAALMGTVLRVQPILSIQGGIIVPVERPRTRRRAVARLRELVLERTGGNQEVWMGIAHARCLDEAEALAQFFRETLSPAFLFIHELGPGIGTHGGPGTLGVALYHPAE